MSDPLNLPTIGEAIRRIDYLSETLDRFIGRFDTLKDELLKEYVLKTELQRAKDEIVKEEAVNLANIKDRVTELERWRTWMLRGLFGATAGATFTALNLMLRLVPA